MVTEISFKQGDLRRALALTLPALELGTNEQRRPILNALNIRLANNRLHVTGCDSFRLSTVKLRGDAATDDEDVDGIDVNLDGKALKGVMTKFPVGGWEDVRITYQQESSMATIYWRGGSREIPIIQGTYPSYELQIKKFDPEASNWFEVGTEALKTVLKATTAVSDFTRVFLEQGQIVVGVRHDEYDPVSVHALLRCRGDVHVCEVDGSDGPVFIGVNGSLLLSLVKGIQAVDKQSKVKVLFKSHSEPMEIRWSDDSHRMVLMPVFLRDDQAVSDFIGDRPDEAKDAAA